MKKTFGLLLSIVLVFSTGSLIAQQWVETIEQDKLDKGELNFYEIQKTFYDYWDSKNASNGFYEENGVQQKAAGWKQFKRWEWFWESRVDAQTGEFPATSAFYEMEKYREQNPRLKGGTSSGNWTSMGPSSASGGYHGVGRLNCVAFHPSNNDVIYVGAAAGGIWKSSNGGSSWIPLSDNNAVLGVSDIIVLENGGSETIYIATGDRDANDNYSVGVLKSTDGGLTWNKTGLNWSQNNYRLVNRMLVDPLNSQVLYAATTIGLYKTSNGGSTWSTITTTVFMDIAFKPGNSAVIYGSTKSGGDIYRSTDSGNNWTLVADTGGRRAQLAVSPANPEFVYSLICSSGSALYGIYKSTNGGASFTEVHGSTPNMLDYACNGSGTGGQGWYDLCIAADPNNANIVFIGGVNTWKSTNGGSNWAINNVWSGTCNGAVKEVHADKHFLAFQNSSSTLFECNDGGLYRTSDGGSSWADLTNGLEISQLYRLGVSQSNVNDVIGGLQDNGTKTLSGTVWSDVIGGDGMECAIDPTNSNIQYGELYYGQIYRTSNNWGSRSNISSQFNATGAWITPFVLDPTSPSIIYAGYADVWKRDFNNDTGWIKLGSSGNTEDLRFIAVAPSNPNVIWASTQSTFYKTTNGGGSWTKILRPTNSSISYISIDSDDPDHVWVSFSQFNSDGVYETKDAGNSWTNISSGLPAIPINCVIENKQNTNEQELYAATDVGIYLKIGDSDWVPFFSGLPNVVVTELEIYYAPDPANSKIRAATYGRGLWESDLYAAEVVDDPVFSLSAQIKSGADDVEEKISDGSMYSNSTDIEIGDDPSTNGDQLEGLLFRSLEIPNGALIQNAYLEFECDEVSTEVTSVVINGEAADNSASFTSTAFNLSSRAKTSASVSWSNIPEWNVVNEKHQSPDLTSIVQEIVSRQGWTSGNNITFVIGGSGRRAAESYDGEALAAAKLFIEYSYNFTTPPVSDFYADKTEIKAGRNVQFTDQSDNIALSWQWSFPGGSPSTSIEKNPVINYSVPGVYDVTLTAGNPAGDDTKTLFGYITVIEPVPGENSFAIIGDFGSGTSNEANVASLINGWNVDFVVTAGDNRYGSTTFDQVVGQFYCSFLKGAGSGSFCDGNSASINSFFPTTGNHEYTDGGGISEYLAYFDLPGAGVSSTGTSGNERYYDFSWGAVDFFMIDSKGALDNATDMANQKSWLQARLAESAAAWKIVVFHHAPYSSSTNHGSTVAMQWPFAEWGADAVISGHDHTYERIMKDGIVYFINGIGGMSLYSIGTPIAGSESQYAADYGAMLVDVTPSSISFQLQNTGGTVIDTYTLNKSVSFTVDPMVAPDATEDSNYVGSLAANVEYNGVETLVYSIESGPSWLLINPNDGSLSGTPLNGDVGQNNFSVKVSAGSDGSDIAGLQITVINTNDAPLFNTDPITGAAANEDSPYTGSLAGTATDDDADNLLFSKVSGPEWLLIDTDGGLSGTPGLADRDANQWTVQVNDGKGGTDNAVLNIFVYPVNHAPLFTEDPFTQANAEEDAAYSGSILTTATDLDGDVLSYSKTAGPAWLSIASNGILSGTPLQSDIGLNSFTVGVTDNKGGTDEAVMKITVINVNDSPVFNTDPIAGAAASEDSPYTGSLAGTATDEDGDNLIFSKVSGPAWLSISTDGSLSGTPGLLDRGLNQWTVRVIDGNGGFDEAGLEIAVQAVNHSPIFTLDPFSETNADEDATYSGTIMSSATDKDGDVLSYSKIGGPSWLSIASNGVLSGTPTQSDVGMNSFNVSVTDNKGGSDEATMNITVVNINDAPVFSNSIITLTEATIGEIVSGSLAGEATDEDGDLLNYSITGGPLWLSINSDGAYTGTPISSDIGYNSWSVNVDDGNGGTATATLELFVVDIANYCDPGIWNSLDAWISAVVFNGSSMSTGNDGGYGFHTDYTFQFDAGTTVNFTLSPGYTGRSPFLYWNIWIDLNKDGYFDGPGENVYSSSKRKNDLTDLFTAPTKTLTTRMRISVSDQPGASACNGSGNGEIEDYTVSIAQAGPKAPVADFSADQTSVIPGATVNFTDLSINNPTSWIWDSGDGQTSNLPNPSFLYSSIGTYTVSLTVANSLGSDIMTKTGYITVAEDNPGLDYCEPVSISNTADYINSINISGVTSSTGMGANGYMHYTQPVFSLISGGTSNVTLNPASGNNRNFWRIWIDLNADGDFEDSDETILAANNKKGSYSSSILIPSGYSGSTRMRIAMETGSSVAPCDDNYYGEVEDYDIVLVASNFIGGREIAEEVNKSALEINLFPNPVKYTLTVHSEGVKEASTIKIYNMLGQEMIWQKVSSDYTELDVTNFEKGIYFLVFESGQEICVNKFVKD